MRRYHIITQKQLTQFQSQINVMNYRTFRKKDWLSICIKQIIHILCKQSDPLFILTEHNGCITQLNPAAIVHSSLVNPTYGLSHNPIKLKFI